MGVTLEIQGIDRFAKAFQSLPSQLEGGVKVTGDPVRYALVWEWGAAWLQQPGPKTMWSVNSAGETAILTIQAPYGFIRVNREKFFEYLRESFQRVNLGATPMTQWRRALEEMLNNAAEQCADIISETAPVDTGALSEHIEIVPAAEKIESTENTYGATEFNVGREWI